MEKRVVIYEKKEDESQRIRRRCDIKLLIDDFCVRVILQQIPNEKLGKWTDYELFRYKKDIMNLPHWWTMVTETWWSISAQHAIRNQDKTHISSENIEDYRALFTKEMLFRIDLGG